MPNVDIDWGWVWNAFNIWDDAHQVCPTCKQAPPSLRSWELQMKKIQQLVERDLNTHYDFGD